MLKEYLNFCIYNIYLSIKVSLKIGLLYGSLFNKKNGKTEDNYNHLLTSYLLIFFLSFPKHTPYPVIGTPNILKLSKVGIIYYKPSQLQSCRDAK